MRKKERNYLCSRFCREIPIGILYEERDERDMILRRQYFVFDGLGDGFECRGEDRGVSSGEMRVAGYEWVVGENKKVWGRFIE